jgi:predicted alpha-1,2-mannosidase
MLSTWLHRRFKAPTSRTNRRRTPPQVERLEPRCVLSLVDYVNPLIGTAPTGNNYGFGYDTGDVFPGADRPFGMLQWSPDTPSNLPGGYWYPDNTIKGFGLDHFSGRGITYMEDIPLMPVAGAVTQSPVANPNAFRSTFSHGNESASPGYYSVVLNSGVQVELTTTLRSGIGQFTFNTGTTTNSIIVNVGGSVNGDSNGAVTVNGSQVTGWAQTTIGGSGDQYKVYFVTQFDQAPTASGTWTNTTLSSGSTSASGGKCGAYLTFDTSTTTVIHVKTAISLVSISNAQLNLSTEQTGWDFTGVRQAARNAWESRLSVIQVDGPSAADKQVFYTALYHTMFQPNIYDDVNGQYLGFDNAVHTVTAGHHQYTNIPGWDEYRSDSALLAILEPDVMSDVVRSYLNDAAQGGGGLPRWEQMNHNSAGMIGDGPLPVIANAYAFGAHDFDATAALTAMTNDASVVGTTSDGKVVRSNLAEYLAQGYIGQDHNAQSAAWALEYENADFALSQFAMAQGDTADYQTYLAQAMSWRNLFDPLTGYLTPLNSNGTFISTNPSSDTGFVEGSQAQYTWLASFGWPALFDLIGGNDVAVSRLDAFFAKLNGGPNSPNAFMGNEPSEGSPWAYDFAAAPWRTQDVVRQIQTQLFTNQVNGLPGNDDAGALSSWYVWSALGIYPAIPGAGGFVIGSPLFTTATVTLAGGSTLQINAPNAADANPYVQSMQINGLSSSSLWLPVDGLLTGPTTTLTFDLGNHPNAAWGSGAADAPPLVEAATLPGQPRHLVAEPGDGQATLSWAAAFTATSYYIYRGVSPGGEDATPVATGVTGTTYTDTGLTHDTTYYYFVTAVNAQGEGPASNEAVGTPEPAPAFNIHVNFTNNLREVPSGYVNDIGLTYGDRGNGFSYGWNLDTTANARDRDDARAPDERYDSFIHLQKPSNPDASWRIALPNGTYSVHLVAGDINDNFDATYAIDVQGTLAVSGTPTSADKFFEGTVTVVVNNGFLAITNGPGSSNDKIDFIDITQVSTASAPPVDLSASFNRTGIVADGSTFAADGGLDGVGNAYSANLLGNSLSAGGYSFALGAAGGNNVVQAAGQTLTLPSGSYSTLAFLATAVNGNQADQTFTVTYTDGTSDTFTQSLSDWHTPQGYDGESIAAAMSYRDVHDGSQHTGVYDLYLYSFSLNPNKTVAGATLPNNGRVEIFAIDLLG